jgi:hypothetical protein
MNVNKKRVVVKVRRCVRHVVGENVHATKKKIVVVKVKNLGDVKKKIVKKMISMIFDENLFVYIFFFVRIF